MKLPKVELTAQQQALIDAINAGKRIDDADEKRLNVELVNLSLEIRANLRQDGSNSYKKWLKSAVSCVQKINSALSVQFFGDFA